MTEVNNSISFDDQKRDISDKSESNVNNKNNSIDASDQYLKDSESNNNKFNNTGGNMIYFSEMSSLQFNNYLKAIGR